MGLDSFAYSVKEHQVNGDFDYDSEGQEFFYWRKNHQLHNWMNQLYRDKGGQDESFNCVKLRLTNEDLDKLERDIRSKTNFKYDDSSYGDDLYRQDLRFIDEARILIDEGKAVYYDSWW